MYYKIIVRKSCKAKRHIKLFYFFFIIIIATQMGKTYENVFPGAHC